MLSQLWGHSSMKRQCSSTPILYACGPADKVYFFTGGLVKVRKFGWSDRKLTYWGILDVICPTSLSLWRSNNFTEEILIAQGTYFKTISIMQFITASSAKLIKVNRIKAPPPQKKTTKNQQKCLLQGQTPWVYMWLVYDIMKYLEKYLLCIY